MFSKLFNDTKYLEKALDGTWLRNKTIDQNIRQESQVRAFNDVIALNGLFALLLLLWGSCNIIWSKYQQRRNTHTTIAAIAAAPSSTNIAVAKLNISQHNNTSKI